MGANRDKVVNQCSETMQAFVLSRSKSAVMKTGLAAHIFSGPLAPFLGYEDLPQSLSEASDPSKWDSSAVHAFFNTVKDELQKKGIDVDADVEKDIFDYLVSKGVPRSSFEHLSLLPQDMRDKVVSQCAESWNLLQDKIQEERVNVLDSLPSWSKYSPAGQQIYDLRLQQSEWSNKTYEDFVAMVKDELQKKGIDVDARVDQQIIEFLIDKNVPNNSIEYVFTRLPLDSNKSPLAAHVKEEADKRYDASIAEQGAALAATWSNGALVIDITKQVSDYASGNTRENWLLSQQKQAVQDIKDAQASNVRIPKTMLTDNGFSSFSGASDEQLEKAWGWVQAKGKAWTEAVETAVNEGKRTVPIPGSSNESTSVYYATVTLRQYELFAQALLRENQKRHQSAYLATSVSGINDEGERMKMYEQIKDFSDATGYVLAVKDGHLYYPGFLSLNVKDIKSLPDNLVVDGFIDLKGSGIKELPHDLKVKGGIYNFNGHDYPPTEAMMSSDGYIDLKKAGVPLSAVPAPEPHKQDAPEPEAKPEKTDVDKRDQQSAPDYNGWNYFTDAFGFSGMGETMSHLGLTLAHLPDVISGIFSGKSSLGLNKGTLLPLAAILLGTQSSNPILKFSLIALGASSLFNKAGKETLANYRGEADTRSTQMQQQTRYRQYEDEELNPRITNPHIEGNVLVVDIDHTPRIVTLPPSVTEAYQSGVIPLNTLANRILEKTDRMQQAAVEAQQDASQQYDRSQDQERGRGIR